VIAGAVFSTEELLLLVLILLGSVVIGFLVGRWWVLLLAFVPMAFGYIDFPLVAGLLALGVGAAKLRRLWLRWRAGKRAADDRSRHPRGG
jgi:hypothetical protein